MKFIQRIIVCAIVLSVAINALATSKSNKDLPYKNSKLPINERVDDLLSRMTLEEKVSQMNMSDLSDLSFDKNMKVTSQSLDSLLNGRSIGCLESPFVGVEEISILSEAADHYLRNNTRLGIPAIQIAECLHGQLAFGATIFPQAIAQGSTWNPELIQKMSATIAEEAKLSGVDQALSPLFDLALDARYGRVEECYGEDPYLVSQMGNAFVIGMQGDPSITIDKIPEGKLACTGKHFVAYSTPIAGINLGPNNVSQRDLRTLHLYPFEKLIKQANVYAIMPAYNEVNGVPMHSNKYLMKDILRDELGFKGYVFSDYEGVAMLNYFHKVTHDKAETALFAVNAGVDLEAPSDFAYSQLVYLVNDGRVDISLIDNAVKNILTVKFKMGLFDKPFKADKNITEKVHTKESVDLSRKIAEESIVLLKNENYILPLNRDKIKSIAVIGPNANQVQYGDYSCTKDNSSGITTYQGIKNLVGNDIDVKYAQGCKITGLNSDHIQDAVTLAEQSDVVVLVIGGTSMALSGIGWGEEIPGDYATCGEGFDRASLDPPGVQPQLIKAIQATGKPVIMVMVHGRPYSIEWEKENIPAIIDAWYPGEEGGNAIANILFGDVNPSGKLPVTFPRSAGHEPSFYNVKPSGRGFYYQRGSEEKPGRDYVFSSPDPLYCFGHGLSYTYFEYSKLDIQDTYKTTDESIEITLEVKNTGQRDGKEVIQVYFNDKVSSVTTPIKVLREFKKVDFKVGERKTVSFSIPIKELGLWDIDMNYIVEPGEFEFMIGSSSDDIRLRKTIVLE